MDVLYPSKNTPDYFILAHALLQRLRVTVASVPRLNSAILWPHCVAAGPIARAFVFAPNVSGWCGRGEGETERGGGREGGG